MLHAQKINFFVVANWSGFHFAAMQLCFAAPADLKIGLLSFVVCWHASVPSPGRTDTSGQHEVAVAYSKGAQ